MVLFVMFGSWFGLFIVVCWMLVGALFLTFTWCGLLIGYVCLETCFVLVLVCLLLGVGYLRLFAGLWVVAGLTVCLVFDV